MTTDITELRTRLAEEHVLHDCGIVIHPSAGTCDTCGEAWPCDMRRVLDELEWLQQNEQMNESRIAVWMQQIQNYKQEAARRGGMAAMTRATNDILR